MRGTGCCDIADQLAGVDASHWTVVHPQHVPAVTRHDVPQTDGVVVAAGDGGVLLHVNLLSVALQLYHLGLRLLTLS